MSKTTTIIITTKVAKDSKEYVLIAESINICLENAENSAIIIAIIITETIIKIGDEITIIIEANKIGITKITKIIIPLLNGNNNNSNNRTIITICLTTFRQTTLN